MTTAIVPTCVNLSAQLEWVRRPLLQYGAASERREEAQAILKSIFWDYHPDLRRFCEGNNGSYRFQVCLIGTKSHIRFAEHFIRIKQLFAEVINREISTLSFRPLCVQAYVIRCEERGFLTGRAPEDSPLVLIPANPEGFKRVNQYLADQLLELNRLWGTSYELDDELHPARYTPHITLVNRVVLGQLQEMFGLGIKDFLIGGLNAKMHERDLSRSILSFKNHRYKLIPPPALPPFLPALEPRAESVESSHTG